jgi:hypothetical protein
MYKTTLPYERPNMEYAEFVAESVHLTFIMGHYAVKVFGDSNYF